MVRLYAGIPFGKEVLNRLKIFSLSLLSIWVHMHIYMYMYWYIYILIFNYTPFILGLQGVTGGGFSRVMAGGIYMQFFFWQIIAH